MKLKYLASCVVAIGIVAPYASAQGDIIGSGWQYECTDFTQDPPEPYSDGYGINLVYNQLFGVSLGVSGQAYWGGGDPAVCYTTRRDLDAAGRLAFFSGQLGSVQSSFDDGIAYSMGAPFDPVGDFCYARILLDDNDPGNSALFGDGGIGSFVGASKRYMRGFWSGDDVQVILTIRSVGDAATLVWEITNLLEEPRPIGLMFGIWPALHTSFGEVDSQTGASMMLATPAAPGPSIGGTNFGTHKWTSDLFSGYIVTPTTKPIRNEHRFFRTSTRFPDWVEFLAGQTDAYGLHMTNIPDATQRKIPIKPLTSSETMQASSADLVRIGQHSFIMWDNEMSTNIWSEPDPFAEEGDTLVSSPGFLQRFPVVNTPGGSVRHIVQIIRPNWGVSDYNEPYAAVLDAPKLINADENGQDGLSPNPMKIRAYLDNQYAKLDEEIAMQNVRFVITLPDGLSLAPGETAEQIVARIGPNEIASVEWDVVSDGVTFGEHQVSVLFDPTPKAAKTLTATIRIAATPRMRIASGAQMVTFPYTFSDNSLGAVLGLEPELDFRAFVWDPEQFGYTQATTAERGTGIWIVPTSDKGYLTLQNANIPNDVSKGGLLYTLKRGWNLIGNPYNYPVPLSHLVAVAEDNPAETFTWAELVSNGFVSSALANWDRGLDGSGVGSYKFTTDQSSVLEPHKGYWIYVTTYKPIRVSWPGVLYTGLSNSGRVDPNGGWSQNEREWRLQLTARTSMGSDTENYIGYVADASKVGLRTVPKPPTAPQDQTVEMVIEGSLNGEPARVAQAVTDRKAKSEWTVHVNNSDAGDVTLTWPNLPSIPRNVRVKLTDTATGEVRDLRAVSGYTYHMNEAGTREFTVSVESGGSTRPVIGNVIVSGDARANGSLTLSYALSADALVSVRVLSGAGKEVFTVTRGRADSAGENEVTWTLRDNANRAVAPGAYRFEILAETPNGERVRRVVPVNVTR